MHDSRSERRPGRPLHAVDHQASRCGCGRGLRRDPADPGRPVAWARRRARRRQLGHRNPPPGGDARRSAVPVGARRRRLHPSTPHGPRAGAAGADGGPCVGLRWVDVGAVGDRWWRPDGHRVRVAGGERTGQGLRPVRRTVGRRAHDGGRSAADPGPHRGTVRRHGNRRRRGARTEHGLAGATRPIRPRGRGRPFAGRLLGCGGVDRPGFGGRGPGRVPGAGAWWLRGCAATDGRRPRPRSGRRRPDGACRCPAWHGRGRRGGAGPGGRDSGPCRRCGLCRGGDPLRGCGGAPGQGERPDRNGRGPPRGDGRLGADRGRRPGGRGRAPARRLRPFAPRRSDRHGGGGGRPGGRRSDHRRRLGCGGHELSGLRR